MVSMKEELDDEILIDEESVSDKENFNELFELDENTNKQIAEKSVDASPC